MRRCCVCGHNGAALLELFGARSFPRAIGMSSPSRCFPLIIVFAGILAGCGSEEISKPGESGDSSASVSTPDGSSANVEAPPIKNQPRETDWFEDVTLRSGVDFTYRNGREGKHYTILETVGGGVALVDYDNDGDLDLFITGGGTISESEGIRGLPPALYRNDGDWNFTEVTAESGLTVEMDYSHACVVGDFDRDGWPDLYVTCYGRDRLFRNRRDGTFEDVTAAAGLEFQSWSTAAAWLDYDADGWPDLFVAGYVEWTLDPNDVCLTGENQTRDTCPPQRYPAAADRLYRNRGDGSFEDVSRRLGVRADGKGLGTLAADFNSDGFVDLYVANDQVENHLYFNDGRGGFTEAARRSGTAFNEFGAPEGSMGVDAADVDGDGLPELFVTNFELEDNSLYLNRGRDQFDHATVRFGLGGKGRPLVGFGTALADFDGDGRPDLLIANGNVSYHLGIHPWAQFPALHRNRDGKRFEEVTGEAGTWFRAAHPARGVAVGDLDNDGGLDVVIVSQNEPAALLRNRRPASRWVRLELAGTNCDPRAVGATVTLTTEEMSFTQFVKSGAGYLSTFDPRLLFPLPESTASGATFRATIRWPDRTRETFESIPANQTHRIVQGHGTQIET